MGQELATKKAFTQEEVKTILGRALRADAKGDLVTVAELQETARELGVSSQALERAMEEHDAVEALQAARDEYRGVRRQSFVRQLASWAAVNTGLVIMDVFPDGAMSWSIYPAAGWGIAVLFSLARTVFMTSEDVDKGAHDLLRERARRHEKLLKARRS